MFQFDSDFYKHCHAERVAQLRTAYGEDPRPNARGGRAMRRSLRRWSRLRHASLRHVPAFRS